ncbi:hypothetical protein WJX74_006008 [Apatococcus lobatus]|uniref:Protein-serine/threonine kinase n=2 Tax=Apatococcus TaxID=904362 RepID=A0AAW1SQ73_9CHLO
MAAAPAANRLKRVAGGAQRLLKNAFEPGSVESSGKEPFSRELAKEIDHFARQRRTSVSLKDILTHFSKDSTDLKKQLVVSAEFLRNELPVRLAHRIAELENLPYGLSGKPQVAKVQSWYTKSFQDLRSFPAVKDASDDVAFTDLLQDIHHRHRNVVPTMAMGIAALKRDLPSGMSMDRLYDVHEFLDSFYMSRIGIRMLIGQHIELHRPPRENYIGMISTNCSPVQVAEDAIQDARAICMRQYGHAPDVTVYGDPNFTFAYVPSHLNHMVFELVKNCLRAQNDHYEDADVESPPVRVIVAEGNEDITIKVSDEGGGISRAGVSKIWTYLYTTATSPLELLDQAGEGEDTPAALAGYGYGLPISRLYARYFGGDLQVIPMEGYGTDAYLHLNRLGNTQEPLP